ncbi:hypothetical protein V491_06719 [Pseudogymnoascus sp. VKM F-3775]|nr:hypothetical protein V491_06719 [Pseudogymnoascus sp. VKM F-3775]
MADSESAPKFAPFLGMAGIAFAMTFGTIGAAYGTAKSGIGISGVGTFRPDLIMKSLIPVVMSGIIAVYSLVIAVLIAGDMAPPPEQHYALFTGGICDWDCGGYGGEELHAAVEDFCGDGVDSYLWGGAGAVWVDCGVDFEYEE